MEEKYSRNWFDHILPVLVRSANRSNGCSLMRFSGQSPRAQYPFSYNSCAAMLGRQRRYHEARVGSFVQVLGFGNHPSLPAPGVLGGIPEFGEHPGGRLGLEILLLGLRQLRGDLFLQALILCQPEDIVEALNLSLPVGRFTSTV